MPEAGGGFHPTERQRELYRALSNTPAEGLTLVGYGGAMGGGKTRAIVELAIDTALSYPGARILIARLHYSDLQTTTMDEFFRACDPRLIAERQRSSPPWVALRARGWPTTVKSTVHFRHLTDWSGLGSEQYGAVFIDEAGEVPEEAAQMLITRLRHPAQSRRWFVAASNPWPGWFERWFARRELPEAELGKASGQIVYIPARVEDNPHLPPNYAAIQRALLPADWVSRFIDGRFDSFRGLIYPEFSPDRHRWDAPLPPFQRYIGGLDFGGQAAWDHYTAGIVAGVTSADAPCGANVLIRLAEFEQRGPGVTERLERWIDDCRRQFGSVTWCADRSQSAWIDHQRRRGRRIRPSQGGPDSVQWGIALVQQRLSAAEPQSYYAPTLTQFPIRMREYQWKQPGNDRLQPLKKDDDLLDADRYCHELAQLQPASRARVAIHTPARGGSARWKSPPQQKRSSAWSVRG